MGTATKAARQRIHDLADSAVTIPVSIGAPRQADQGRSHLVVGRLVSGSHEFAVMRNGPARLDEQFGIELVINAVDEAGNQPYADVLDAADDHRDAVADKLAEDPTLNGAVLWARLDSFEAVDQGLLDPGFVVSQTATVRCRSRR